MRVLLVTSWDTPCGIAEHSKLLIEAVRQADPKIEILPDSEALDPAWTFHELPHPTAAIDLVHLNHHDGLHSRWLPSHVQELTTRGIPVLITYHDTRATLAECPKLEALAQVASSVIVHEPVEGLKAIYWRQGVPAAATAPADYGGRSTFFMGDAWQDGEGPGTQLLHRPNWKAFPQQPVLGSVGFNFPWKNFDKLAQITGEEGWALVLLSNNATEEDEQRWRALNSSILVVRKFLPQNQVINYLAGCDATAFMYECANTGTSAAIRQGIAARKPVIALSTCRQFRDLWGQQAITWVEGWASLRGVLRGNTRLPLQTGRIDLEVAALAHQESWTALGENYAQLYHMLGARS